MMIFFRKIIPNTKKKDKMEEFIHSFKFFFRFNRLFNSEDHFFLSRTR